MPKKAKIRTVTNVQGEMKNHLDTLKDNYTLNQQREEQEISEQHVMKTRRLPTPKPKTVQRTEPTPGQQAAKERDDAKKLNQAHNKELKTRGLKK